jgi:hypothetical protein
MTFSTLLQSAVAYATQHPETSAALAAGLVTAVAHYRRTGRLPLGRLPLRELQQTWRRITDRYTRRSRPRGVPGVLVDAPPAEVATQLRAHHFEDIDTGSYEYEDEAWSFRRPEGLGEHPTSGADLPVELHPRGFRTDGGRTLVLAHMEASRLEAWQAHIAGTLLSWDRGRDRISKVLHDAGYSPTPVRSERGADVEVVPPQSD